MLKKQRKNTPHGFTLVEILVALAITSILTTAIYRFFIGQHHAYTVQDQVIEMEQNARAAMDMIRRELRMAGYHAMGDDLINNLSDFVPATFIPTYPVIVNLDTNPKISEGSGTEPDVITLLSVVPTDNNPTTLSTAVLAGSNQMPLSLTATQTGDQYNVGDMVHIGSSSEYATVTAISENTLTIDTNPGDSSSSQGLANGYAAGTPIGEIYVVSYAVFNEENDPTFTRHEQGHPVLKRKANGAGFMPVAENITDMQLLHLGSGEIQLTLSSRTDRADHKFQSNGGYRTYVTNANVKVRNADTVAAGTDCDLPSAPTNVVLNGLNDTYPCQIHITWEKVTGASGCAVSGYKIFYGTTSGSYPYSVDVGDVDAYTLDVLPVPACTYYVAVAAVNSAGTGPRSTESITDIQAPAIPTGFKAENINGVERKVTLSWDMNTECDLQRYRINGRINGSDFSEGTFISKVFTNYSATINDTATDFTIDCGTYNYSIEAADFCPNLSGPTTEVSVSPTAPAPPTGPIFSVGDGTDTISWTPSADDFVVTSMNSQNYIVGYEVKDPDGNEVTLNPGGIKTWTSPSNKDYYDVRAIDACGLKSSYLGISSVCAQPPVISIISPSGDTDVSGTINIDGTVYLPAERTIASIKLKIDNEPWIATGNISPWGEWDTTQVANGSHIVTVRATDSEGCYGEESITVTVSNEASVTPQVFCTLFTCIDPPGANNKSFINLVVYVYDHEGNPVSDALVNANILFGSGAGSKDIPATTIPGYYGGEDTAACTFYSDDPEASIPASDIAIKTKSFYGDNEILIIEINVTKEGLLGSTCITTLTAE